MSSPPKDLTLQAMESPEDPAPTTNESNSQKPPESAASESKEEQKQDATVAPEA